LKHACAETSSGESAPRRGEGGEYARREEQKESCNEKRVLCSAWCATSHEKGVNMELSWWGTSIDARECIFLGMQQIFAQI